MSFKSRILNILFWSVISAAFIGPGTITTAAKAGSVFQFNLLWALVFSTFACLLLQEASARITIFSGKNLGEAIAYQLEGKSTRVTILVLVAGAIILGSAAYEAGNILGAVAGLILIFDISPVILVLVIGIVAFLALNIPSLQVLAKLMGIVVVLMGFSFVTTAILSQPSFNMILKGSFIPSVPEGAGGGLLILGLIGTTVVPYNLFLGSGMSDKSQKISEMRFGLSVAIILGGIISMAVLIVGAVVIGDFTYEALSEALTSRLGTWSVYMFGLGMFAAGFSSAITAPLASAITAKSLFGYRNKEKWKIQSLNYKLVWGLVLLVGISFGLTNIEPIPAIILAQALNGFILPFISIFLLFVINDPKLMGENGMNGWFSNILMGIVVWVTLILGLTNVIRAAGSAFNFIIPEGNLKFIIILIITLIITAWVMIKVYFIRFSKK